MDLLGLSCLSSWSE